MCTKRYQDLDSIVDKLVNQLLVCDSLVIRPSKNFHEFVELQKNKQAFIKEYELKDQLERLKLELEQLKKIDHSEDQKLDDTEVLMKYLHFLKKVFNEKINEYETKKNQLTINTEEYIDQFQAQSKFLENKQNEIKELNLLSTVDMARLKIEDNLEENKTEKVKIEYSANEYFDIDFVDRVASELQFQKHDLINKDLKLSEIIKKTDKKKKKYQEYITICDLIFKICEEILSKKYEKDAKNEYENTVKIIEKELNNFNINKLKNFDKIIHNSESLSKILTKSVENLKVSEEKISNLVVNKKNVQGQKIKEMFEANITFAKQNNNLMTKIIEYQKKYNHILLDKIIKCDNPPDFIEKKNMIEKFKLSVYNVQKSGDNLNRFNHVNLDASYNY